MNDLSHLRKLLAALVLAGVAGLMLSACSSTEESSSTGDDSCAQQCAAAPDINQDECMIACEGEI